MPKFLSAMAWFTKENLIANSPKTSTPIIIIGTIIIDFPWLATTTVLTVRARIAQRKIHRTRIIPTRNCAPRILLISFLLIIVQKSLNHRSSFLAQPRISGTNIAVISRSARVAIRFIISSVVSGSHPRSSVPMPAPNPKREPANPRANPIKNRLPPFHFVRDISRPNDLSSWRFIFRLFCMSVKL